MNLFFKYYKGVRQTKTNERNGIVDFMKIIRAMPSFEMKEFGIDDIVRSGLVKEYLIAKLEAGL